MNNRQLVQLTTATGEQFTAFILKNELQLANEDSDYASKVINKYYEIHKKNARPSGILIPAPETVAFPSTNSVPFASKPRPAPKSILTQPIDDEETQGGEQPYTDEELNYVPTKKTAAFKAKADNIFAETVDDETQGSELCVEELRDYFTEEDDELLISLVSSRPPLFDMRIPLKHRSREIIKNLWDEIVSELNIKVTVQQISGRWKNIRDRYLRARSNVNKKIASGSSSEDKIRAENIKAKHKHYALLQFLDDTLNTRKTSSNVSNITVDEETQPLLTPPTPTSTNSSRSTKRTAEEYLEQADAKFFNRLDNLRTSTSTLTASQHFCMRLAESLDKLPKHVKNKLEIDFLQKVSEAEELHNMDKN